MQQHDTYNLVSFLRNKHVDSKVMNRIDQFLEKYPNARSLSLTTAEHDLVKEIIKKGKRKDIILFNLYFGISIVADEATLMELLLLL